MKGLYLLIGALVLATVAIIGFNFNGNAIVKKDISNQEKSTELSTFSKPPFPKGGQVKAVEKVSEKPLRIAVLAVQNRSPFWYSVRDGVYAAKEYLSYYNATVDYIVIGDTVHEDIISSLRELKDENYDGIIVPPFYNEVVPIINEIVEMGTPVITYNAEGKEKSKRLLFIGQNSYEAGRFSGKQLAEITEGHGKVGIINGYEGVAHHEERKKGAVDYLKEHAPDVEVIGVYENQDKAEKAYVLTTKMIEEHPDLKAVYVIAGGPFGAAKAIKDMGLTGKIHVVCYDLIPENLKYIQSGEIAAAIGQDPFRQAFDASVYLYNYLAAKQLPEKRVISIDMQVVNLENINEYLLEN